MNSNAI